MLHELAKHCQKESYLEKLTLAFEILSIKLGPPKLLRC